MGPLGKPIPVNKRRDPGVTKFGIIFDFWVEISPFSYFRWRLSKLSARFRGGKQS
jgi:hypothetical protein